MKRMLLIYFLILSFLISCKSPGPTKPISISTDTLKNIKSEYFPSIIKQDSIKILKFETSIVDSSKEESLLYIDFKRNNPDKRKIQEITSKEIVSKAREYMNSVNSIPKDSILNPFPEILGTYIRVEKFNGDYCINFNQIDYFFCITDSLFVSRSQEGFEGYSFSNFSKKNGNYVIGTLNKPENTTIEIKFLKDKYNACVWRETYYLFKSEPKVIYRLLVPVKNITNIPIIYTLYSAGFDDSFDGFDKISLGDLFNK